MHACGREGTWVLASGEMPFPFLISTEWVLEWMDGWTEKGLPGVRQVCVGGQALGIPQQFLGLFVQAEMG